jgi:hypothetical protein
MKTGKATRTKRSRTPTLDSGDGEGKGDGEDGRGKDSFFGVDNVLAVEAKAECEIPFDEDETDEECDEGDGEEGIGLEGVRRVRGRLPPNRFFGVDDGGVCPN